MVILVLMIIALRVQYEIGKDRSKEVRKQRSVEWRIANGRGRGGDYGVDRLYSIFASVEEMKTRPHEFICCFLR